MGNRTSSRLFSGKKTMIKLVDADGKLRFIAVTPDLITAAELMLENPGFAVSPLDNIVKTGRIPAICADEVLRGGKTYLLVPLGKVNAKVTDNMKMALERTLLAEDKKRWSSAASRKKGGLFCSSGCSGVSRVSPVNLEATSVKEAEKVVGMGNAKVVGMGNNVKMDLLSVLKGKCMGGNGGCGRITSSRRWCPVLDPIIEE